MLSRATRAALSRTGLRTSAAVAGDSGEKWERYTLRNSKQPTSTPNKKRRYKNRPGYGDSVLSDYDQFFRLPFKQNFMLWSNFAEPDDFKVPRPLFETIEAVERLPWHRGNRLARDARDNGRFHCQLQLRTSNGDSMPLSIDNRIGQALSFLVDKQSAVRTLRVKRLDGTIEDHEVLVSEFRIGHHQDYDKSYGLTFTKFISEKDTRIKVPVYLHNLTLQPILNKDTRVAMKAPVDAVEFLYRGPKERLPRFLMVDTMPVRRGQSITVKDLRWDDDPSVRMRLYPSKQQKRLGMERMPIFGIKWTDPLLWRMNVEIDD